MKNTLHTVPKQLYITLINGIKLEVDKQGLECWTNDYLVRKYILTTDNKIVLPSAIAFFEPVYE